MKMTSGMTATGNIVASTPKEFFNRLSSVFNFTLDACALPENAKCKDYYTPNDDGLSNPWRGGGMVQPALWKRDIRMGQERLRGVQKRLQRLRSYATSSQNRYEVVVGLGAGKSISFLRQRKDKVQRRKCRSAVPKCFGVVYEGYKRRKRMKKEEWEEKV